MISFELLKSLISEMIGQEFEITRDTKLIDLGLDSLDILQLLQEVEKATGTPIDIGKIDSDRSLAELVELLNI